MLSNKSLHNYDIARHADPSLTSVEFDMNAIDAVDNGIADEIGSEGVGVEER